MRLCGITAQWKKKKSFLKPNDQKQPDMHQKGICNHLKHLCPIAPDIVWRTDFTHIIFFGVHLYLATILDEYTKKIVGYALSWNHTKEFVLEALKDAVKKAWTTPHYIHSDQGSEYTSFLFMQYLADHQITLSMSRKWSPWENGAQESYYGKLKLELGDPKSYETSDALILAIHQRIHYYNHKRLHTKHRDTPAWFERKYFEKYPQRSPQNISL